jgi:hypothetical protein
MITVNISNNEINKAIRDINKYSKEKAGALLKEMERTAYKIDSLQKENLRSLSSKSGKNYSSMIAANHVKINKAGKTANISNDHKAAGYFEKGTKSHNIAPKNKRWLATLSEYSNTNKFKFRSTYKGSEYKVFSTGNPVMHPGTKAKPFFFKAVEKVKQKYIENMKKILSNAK